jgi:hypothetical protein
MAGKTRKQNSRAAHVSSYPSQGVLDQLASLAQIPDSARKWFSSEIKEVIRFAHKVGGVRKLRLHPRDKIVSILNQSAQCTRQLRELLSDIDGVPITPKVIAGKYLRAALLDKGVRVEDALAFLNTFAAAGDPADQAVKSEHVGQGRPVGTSYNEGFDLFVEQLFLAVKSSSGKLTHYKSAHADKGWAGTLLQSLELLRPWLPDQFPLMNAISGKSLDRIAQRYRQPPKKVSGKS